MCQPWPLSCLIDLPDPLSFLAGPPTLCSFSGLPPLSGSPTSARAGAECWELQTRRSASKRSEQDVPQRQRPGGGEVGVGVGGQGGCWRLGRGRGRGWRHSRDESLSPAWRAAEGPSLVCLRSLWELCLGEIWQYLRLPPVSGGPHFRREDGLRLSGARSPSLQKRLSSHFTGENSEAEGGGRRACDGPTPNLLSVSFQLPLLQAELPQQPQPLAWTLQG